MNSLVALTIISVAVSTANASVIGLGIASPLAWGSVGPSGITSGAGTAGPSGIVNGLGAAGPAGIVNGRGAIGPTGPNGLGVGIAVPAVATPSLAWGSVGPSGITTGAGTAGPSGIVNGLGAAGPAGIVNGRGAIGPTGPNGIGLGIAAPGIIGGSALSLGLGIH